MALVVDDEPSVRNVATDYLKAMGFCPVIVADGGSEVLQCLGKYHNS